MASSSNQLNSAGSTGGVQITQAPQNQTLLALVVCALIASVTAILFSLRRK